MHSKTVLPVDRYYFGLDLGQPWDTSSLAIVERTYIGRERHYRVRHLQRWPAGTAYPRIRDEVAEKMADAAIRNCTIGVDQTAVGKGIVDLFCCFRAFASIQRLIITAGRTPAHNRGIQFVPKIDLAATLQKLLQTNRVQFAKLPETPTLVKELSEFRTKIPAFASDDSSSWREQPHDDLCFAVMMACWLGERPGLEWMLLPTVISRGPDLHNPYRP